MLTWQALYSQSYLPYPALHFLHTDAGHQTPIYAGSQESQEGLRNMAHLVSRASPEHLGAGATGHMGSLRAVNT